MGTLKSVRRPDGFVRIFNEVVKQLSIDQTGLLVYLLSKPPEWEFSCQRIATETSEGLYRVRRIRAELEAAGYVLTVNTRLPNGQLRRDMWVRDALDVTWPNGLDRVGPEPSSAAALFRQTRAVSKKEFSSQKEMKNRRRRTRLDESDAAWERFKARSIAQEQEERDSKETA